MSNRYDMNTAEARAILQTVKLPETSDGELLTELFDELDSVEESTEKSFTADITKVDADKHLVFGWVTVAEEKGKPLVDKQGDVMSPEAMEDMAYNFTLNCRKGGEMHWKEKVGVGKLVESMAFTKEKQEALGIDLGKVGWWCGFKISDPDVWAKVKDGTYKAFSIHGKGLRQKIAEVK